MKTSKKLRTTLGVFIVLVVFLLQSSGFAKDITICSFNIQFLGSSKERDNKSLTDILKPYDIVVVQELVAPPYKGKFPNGDAYKPDKVVTEFFDMMSANNF